jgi:nucleoside-diphosphate-sugar epimerase
MRIFIAGATGAIGARLIPLLVAAGHQIVGTTRTPDKLERLRAQGADGLVVDGLDEDAVMKAVVSTHPDAVVNEMTALSSLHSVKHLDDEFKVTNRLRTEGTRHLLAAARVVGARRIVAQSYSGWPNERRGGRVKTEDDPLDSNPPHAMTQTLDAIRALEQMVSNASGLEGIVLRYGTLYGPGTSLSGTGEIVELIRQRQFPLIGDGAGVWSFVHVDDAARATKLAIERGVPGIYNIVDDEPAEVSVWLPDLAQVVGAQTPFRLAGWIGRFAVGDAGVSMMTEVRGSSNAKAKRVLGWQPEFASWRDGFRHGLSDPPEVEYMKAV